MAVYNSYDQLPKGTSAFGGFVNELIPVRVVDVILDSSHPEYKKYGYTTSIGVIKFTFMDKAQDLTDPTILDVAYPISSNIRTLPLKNEIVFIIAGPDLTASSEKGTNSRIYYTNIISMWNHPTHGKSRRIGDNTQPEDRYGFPSIPGINPLQPYPGDVLIEGRLGQSIRLGGADYKGNNLTDGSNNGSPFMLISNGRIREKASYGTISEDINQDASSIYLMSNHTVPIVHARSKHISTRAAVNKAANNPTGIPNLGSSNYKGSQVVISSGRLVFNAKDEDIDIASKGTFSVSSNIIGLDAVDEIGLDAKKIYLGTEALKEFEPAVRGGELESFLIIVLQMMEIVKNTMRDSLSDSGGTDLSGQLNWKTMDSYINQLRSQLPNLKSKKVFIEANPNATRFDVPTKKEIANFGPLGL